MTETSTVVGVFSDRDQADRAIDSLLDSGFSRDQIGVITKDRASKTSSVDVDDSTSDTAENAGTGAAVGAAAGAGIGGLVGLGVLSGVIPVIGPAIAAGTLGVILSNAAGGAAVAGLVGALTGWGVPEEHANHYVNEFQAGRIIVTVMAGSRGDEARSILRSYGATSRDPAFANSRV